MINAFAAFEAGGNLGSAAYDPGSMASSPANFAKMLEFATQHGINPVPEVRYSGTGF